MRRFASRCSRVGCSRSRLAKTRTAFALSRGADGVPLTAESRGAGEGTLEVDANESSDALTAGFAAGAGVAGAAGFGAGAVAVVAGIGSFAGALGVDGALAAAGFAAGALALAASDSSEPLDELGVVAGLVGGFAGSATNCAVFPRSGEVEAIEALVAFVPADEGAIGSADGVGGFAVSVVGALGAVAGAGFPPGIGSGFERDGVVPVAAGVAAGAGFGGAAADGVPESESKRNIEVGFPPVAGALALGVEGLELGVDGVGPVLKIGAGAGFAAGPSPGDVLLETVGDPVLKIGAGVGFESEGDPSPGEVLLEPVSKIGVGAGFDAVVVDGVPAAALSGDAGLLSAAFAASSGDFGSVIAGDS